MNTLPGLLLDISIIALFLVGISRFKTPPEARKGNQLAAVALSVAFILVLLRFHILTPELVLLALVIGAGGGWLWAMRVNMTQIPAMVAFQNGAGGCAAMLVSLIEMTRLAGDTGSLHQIFGVVGIIAGAVTFSGSMIAAGKLAGKLQSTPLVIPRHNQWLLGLLGLMGFLGILTLTTATSMLLAWLLLLTGAALALGFLFAGRVGGADMPVLISFLNATTGLAAAFCGMIIENRLLIACGALVAASGYILTWSMCKAMNRNLKNVLMGYGSVAPETAAVSDTPSDTLPGTVDTPEGVLDSAFTRVVDATTEAAADTATDDPSAEPSSDPWIAALDALKAAQSVIFIPGYGMALAQAQFNLVSLGNHLEKIGKCVKYAIHPVAGRMPGHMNVLLAEADIDYEKLYDMDTINTEFANTDVALVAGACDVVNPAAIHVEGTPISGMPILKAYEARRIIICNLDLQPGYSGVENPLYKEPKAILLPGNAKETLARLLEAA